MTTKELMEFFKNAYKKERENSNKLCMLKDEEIERLREQLSSAETIFKIIKRNMENPNWHKDRSLTELEIAIKSQVVGYLERYGVK